MLLYTLYQRFLNFCKTRTHDERLLENADPFTNADLCYGSLWWGTAYNTADHWNYTPKGMRTVALYYYIYTDNLLRTRNTLLMTHTSTSKTLPIFNFISL